MTDYMQLHNTVQCGHCPDQVNENQIVDVEDVGEICIGCYMRTHDINNMVEAKEGNHDLEVVNDWKAAVVSEEVEA